MGKASRGKRDRFGRETERRPPTALETLAGSRSSARERGKLSGALVALIAPYRDEVHDLAGYQLLVSIAVIAWNLATLPEEERDAALLQAAGELDVSGRAALQDTVAEFILRKHRLFPDDRRMIVSYEVTETDGAYHVIVASAALS